MFRVEVIFQTEKALKSYHRHLFNGVCHFTNNLDSTTIWTLLVDTYLMCKRNLIYTGSILSNENTENYKPSQLSLVVSVFDDPKSVELVSTRAFQRFLNRQKRRQRAKVMTICEVFNIFINSEYCFCFLRLL